jgi:hypothetical protein
VVLLRLLCEGVIAPAVSKQQLLMQQQLPHELLLCAVACIALLTHHYNHTASAWTNSNLKFKNPGHACYVP